MHKLWTLILVACVAMPAWADHCAIGDSTTVSATFERVFTGSYRPGQPFDVVTARPDGEGETLAQLGITVSVRIVDCLNQPRVGIPAQNIILFHSDLHICGNGGSFAVADGPTDSNGETVFTGTIPYGGCSDVLDIYVDGIFVGQVPVKVNSTDLTNDGFVDSSDIANLASRLGTTVGTIGYSICSDWNEDGATDSGDVAVLVAALATACP